MLPTFRYQTERRLRGILVMSGLVAAFGAMMLAFWPSISEASDAITEYIDAMPDILKEAFGVTDFSTIGGFLATEMYQFVWVILLGFYFAYRAGSIVAADVENHRIDLLLATPVSRTRILLERFLALVPLMILVNLVTLPVIYGGIVLVGESISLTRLLAVHGLSIPYFLACASVGAVLSVVLDSESLANRLAVGAIFALFMIDTLSTTADAGWVGAISPTRYYDSSRILVQGDIDLAGSGILLVGAVLLVALAVLLFRRADIT